MRVTDRLTGSIAEIDTLTRLLVMKHQSRKGSYVIAKTSSGCSNSITVCGDNVGKSFNGTKRLCSLYAAGDSNFTKPTIRRVACCGPAISIRSRQCSGDASSAITLLCE